MITRRYFRPFVFLLLLAASFLLTSHFSAAAAISAPESVKGLRVPASAADDVPKIELVGQLGGAADAVAVVGNLAYVGEGSALVILDVRGAQTPTMMGKTASLAGRVTDVAVAGNFAFVSAGYGGLHIINVADPTAPVEAAFYNTPGYAYAVKLAGSCAYVLESGGLHIINIVDPAAPVEAGFYEISRPFDIAVAGEYAYVADGWGGSGMHIINIADPAAPFEEGLFETEGMATAVAVAGDYAYVADYDHGLRIISIADAAAPVEVGFIESFGSYGVTVAGDHAYMTL